MKTVKVLKSISIGSVLLFALMILATMLSGCGAQSRLQSGDVSTEEVAKSTAIYSSLIQDYRAQKTRLQDHNINLAAQAEDLSIGKTAIQELLKQIDQNNLLITSYSQKIAYLEEQLSNFIVSAAGKDKKRSLDVNVYEGALDGLANIMAMEAYEKAHLNAGLSTIDSAAVISYSDHQIQVDIFLGSQPITAFLLPGTFNKNRPVIKIFKIPGPGHYRIVYTNLDGDGQSQSSAFVSCLNRKEVDNKSVAFFSTVSNKF
ncbi:MAG: hypothetical protein WC456_03405 [Patescibacteria group bacterium]